MKLTQWTINSLALLALATSALGASINDRNRWTSRDKMLEALKNPKSPAHSVDLPQVDVKGAELKGREVPVRGLSTKPMSSAPGVTTVDEKQVEIKHREVSTHESTMHATPVSNFTAKRAPVQNKTGVDTPKMYATDSAPIPSRRIQVRSPEGLEELRKQLNREH
jgi:hypothetical protein